jgi:hypothetical protein
MTLFFIDWQGSHGEQKFECMPSDVFLEFIIIYICLFKLLIRRKIIDDLMFLSGLPFDRFSIPNLFWHPQKLLQMQIMLQFLELLVMRLVML